ncbi:MAG: OmpA family protein [Spirochaetaceae bacterium]|jgi:outer membrane protein OmpA-like peptidoglycan-associated protein|nr:OmpA family protein [Spirochaetaceae bacterium]
MKKQRMALVMNKTDKMKKKRIIAALCAIFALVPASLAPEESRTGNTAGNTAGVMLSAGNTGSYKLVERSDWSRYDNGKYRGHVYREVRASITPEENRGARVYRGNFIVLEETLRNMESSARGVDDVIPVQFTLEQDGSVTIEDDRGFPSLRGFPAFPAAAVRPGDRWTARGVRAVDPLNQGQMVPVPIIAEYEYRGTELYRDTPVHRITAVYASRYQGGPRAAPEGETFTAVQGSHTVDILLRVSDGLPLMMRDTLDETYTWAGGSTVRFRGFTLTFGEGTIPLNRDVVIARLGGALNRREPGGTGATAPTAASPGAAPPAATRPALPAPSALPPEANIDVAPVPEGVRLTLRDLRFVPDSDELLPEEQGRLDLIAAALRAVPDRSFLVEGHTAAVGRTEGEMTLSLRRAERITGELARRGIPADRFMYKGWGGTKPVASNTDEAGRARNRRVEITILE